MHKIMRVLLAMLSSAEEYVRCGRIGFSGHATSLLARGETKGGSMFDPLPQWYLLLGNPRPHISSCVRSFSLLFLNFKSKIVLFFIEYFFIRSYVRIDIFGACGSKF